MRVTPLRRQDVDMTQGNITRHILMFALPLVLGNLFQQMYNLVDTYVVGKYATNEAYAAVGSVGVIVNIFIGLFSGFATGAGVVISQHFGAHDTEKVSKTVHTAALTTLILCPIFTALGLGLTPLMLQWNNTPTNVLPESTTYLSVYFWGISGLLIYNMGAGILRAVGDSKRPFYYLVVCACMNAVLDVVFVAVLKMGVAGVALSTALAQWVSAILVVIQLLRTSSVVKLRPKAMALHLPFLRQIVRVGIPASVQMSITAFSNVFVQSYINYFREDFMSAWTTYSKVDAILFLPMQSIGMAVSTFVGQNLGAGQVDRAKKGVRTGLISCLLFTGLGMIPILIFAPHIVRFLNDKPQVVEYGTLLLRIITPFFLVSCFSHLYSGALRGAGDSRAPMIIMLSTFVGARQLYLFIMSRVCNQVIPIALAYPVGWILCSAVTTIYYHRTKLENNSLRGKS